MIVIEKVDLSQMNPEELKDTLLAVSKEETPGRDLIFRLIEPQVLVGGKQASIIRERRTLEGFIVDWETMVRGGTDKGLVFTGLVEELRLRYPAKPPHRYLIE